MPYDAELLDRLTVWRRDEAARRSVPVYVVLTDATLEVLATDLPTDVAGLVAVPGIGARKLSDYGDALLALVRGETPLEPTRDAASESDEPA